MNGAMTDHAAQNGDFINLRYLPFDHPLRRTLLIALKAEFKHPAWAEFKPLEHGRPLEKNTYNTLSRGWQDFYEWRIPKEAA